MKEQTTNEKVTSSNQMLRSSKQKPIMEVETVSCIFQMSCPFMDDCPMTGLLASLPNLGILYHGIDNRNICLKQFTIQLNFKDRILLQLGYFAVLFTHYHRVVRKASHTQKKCLERYFEASVLGSVIQETNPTFRNSFSVHPKLHMTNYQYDAYCMVLRMLIPVSQAQIF